MLVNADVNAAKDTVLYLHSIFRAIMRVEDAVDVETSPVRVCNNKLILSLAFVIPQFYQLNFFLFFYFFSQ